MTVEIVDVATTGLLGDGEESLGTENSPMPCLCCGECCARYQVHLSLVEARGITDKLGISWREFVDQYTDRSWPGTKSFLLRHEQGACVFLERGKEGGHALCRIHSFKPVSCQEWTPGVYRPECQAGMKRLQGPVVD